MRYGRQREAAGLTQDGLARRLSEAGLVTAMTSISRWELNKVTPPLHRRLVIQKVLEEAVALRRRGHPEGEIARWQELTSSDPPEIQKIRIIHAATRGGKGPYWEHVVRCVEEAFDMIEAATGVAQPKQLSNGNVTKMSRRMPPRCWARRGRSRLKNNNIDERAGSDPSVANSDTRPKSGAKAAT